MTRQQAAYAELRFYRLAIHACLCLENGRRVPIVAMGAMRTAGAERGRLLGHYLVCLN